MIKTDQKTLLEQIQNGTVVDINFLIGNITSPKVPKYCYHVEMHNGFALKKTINSDNFIQWLEHIANIEKHDKQNIENKFIFGTMAYRNLVSAKDSITRNYDKNTDMSGFIWYDEKGLPRAVSLIGDQQIKRAKMAIIDCIKSAVFPRVSNRTEADLKKTFEDDKGTKGKIHLNSEDEPNFSNFDPVAFDEMCHDFTDIVSGH